MKVTYKLDNPEATENFGRLLAKYLTPPFMMGLSGSIGMGKTCLTRALIQAKGIRSRIKSPSFTLLETYSVPGAELNHFDLYRLDSVFELEELGFRDYLNSQSICMIEWPERAPMLQPLLDLMLEFSYISESDGRILSLNANSIRGEQVLKALQGEPCLKK
jgi:tRNA threonylcarbamoyladenosine biosynthesis protein TsaE